MIRGVHLSGAAIAGSITMTVFVFRALSRFFAHPLIEFMINPYVVFFLFIIAAVVVTHHWLKGPKALIIAPIMVIAIAFFVYAYYVL